MKHIAPVIQTLLWVSLIGGGLWYFRSYVEAILKALEARISRGDGVKAWGLELIAVPLSPQEQADKLIQEVREVEDEGNAAAASPRQAQQIAHDYILAEDLALRAIQEEYGELVSRQARLGTLRVDGAFTKNGELNIIEIKISGAKTRPSLVQMLLDQFDRRFSRSGWKRVRVILVFVYANEVDLGQERSRIEAIVEDRDLKFAVEVRCYQFDELMRRYTNVPMPIPTL